RAVRRRSDGGAVVAPARMVPDRPRAGIHQLKPCACENLKVAGEHGSMISAWAQMKPGPAGIVKFQRAMPVVLITAGNGHGPGPVVSEYQRLVGGVPARGPAHATGAGRNPNV